MHLTNLIYQTFAGIRGDELAWKLGSNRLRLLCYHGVCDDRLADAHWMPEYFVTRSALESQLRYLKANAQVLPLGEAVERLKNDSLPPRAVCLTFDDGYANNIEIGAPLLEQYGMTATIFLSSAYIESGEFYPFLKLRLIRLNAPEAELMSYKSNPLDRVMESAARWWPEVKNHLSEDQHRTLRPMTIAEVSAANPQVLAFGAHTHTHCILSNESLERRCDEIRTSIHKVAQWTGRPVRVFSYPNGEPGDFQETDKQVLRSEGVEVAVTGVFGANRRAVDPLELRRYPVTIHHDASRFRGEVTGFRTVLRSMSERRLSA